MTLEEQIFYSDYANIILGLPWRHNTELLDKVKDQEQRLCYAIQTVKNGWSRNVLVYQINSDLYKRKAKKEIKTNNFEHTLPIEQSETLEELIKDEYNLEFIDNIHGLIKERKLEDALVNNIVKFLLELGKGFAFVGKQYHLEVSSQDFFIDLLFYHIKLKSYVAIELKTGKYKPEYAGKMGFYLACIDDYLKDKNDNNSIGIILCQDDDKDREIREKSLQCMIKPIGVSNYKITKEDELPEELKPLREIRKLIK